MTVEWSTVVDASEDASYSNGAAVITEPHLAPLLLRKDLRKAAATLGVGEVRFLVDVYYQWQDFRIASGNQALALTKSGEPHEVIQWTQDRMASLEDDIRAVLDTYTRTEPTGMGQWARSIVGIGPVIAAGLCAHIDITKAPTVGHIWRFAGLDPTQSWNKGEKRPWNADLKVLCWKAGESFVKVQNNPRDVYGKVYAKRKLSEQQHNEAGLFADQCASKLQKFKIGKDTEAYYFYAGCLTVALARQAILLPSVQRIKFMQREGLPVGEGVAMLPPAHIHARAKRVATKLFLAHYHEQAYRRHYGTEPPLPYPVAHMGHAHVIPAPD